MHVKMSGKHANGTYQCRKTLCTPDVPGRLLGLLLLGLCGEHLVRVDQKFPTVELDVRIVGSRLQSLFEHVNAAGLSIADSVAFLHHVPQPLWDNLSSRVHAQFQPRVQEDQAEFHVEKGLLRGSCHAGGRAHWKAESRVDCSVGACLGGCDQGNTITGG